MKRQHHLFRKVAKKRKLFVLTKTKKNREKLKDWTSAPNRENKQTKIITAHEHFDSSSPSN